MDKVDFKMDWCSHEAAKYACEHWHYSKCVPKSKQAKMGVWEKGKYIGCIMYGNSSGCTVFDFLGLDQATGCELTRIALNNHIVPVSKIIKVSLIFIHKAYSGLRGIISYADTNQGHNGAIYQASNWKFYGKTTKTKQWYFRGKWRNDMKLNEFFKGKKESKEKLKTRVIDGKYKYVYFFDKLLEGKEINNFKPYPKRETKCG